MDSVLTYILPLISAALSAALLAAFKRIGRDFANKLSTLHDISEANNQATFVMLQDRILQSCKHWQQHEYIPAHDAEMLQRLFEQYKAMGGNGYVAKQVEITLELPQE